MSLFTYIHNDAELFNTYLKTSENNIEKNTCKWLSNREKYVLMIPKWMCTFWIFGNQNFWRDLEAMLKIFFTNWYVFCVLLSKDSIYPPNKPLYTAAQTIF